MAKGSPWLVRVVMLVLLVAAALSASVAVSHHHESSAPGDDCSGCAHPGSVGSGGTGPGCAPSSADEEVDLAAKTPIVAGCTPQTRAQN